MARLSQDPLAERTLRNEGPLKPRAFGAGVLLGVPVGDLGWFASLLMGFAGGFAAFFAATFLGIMAILFYNTVGHHSVDFALSYKRIGFPLGVVVAFVALTYLGGLWIRRQLRRA